MKTTKETLNDLIIQYKSEMLINDPLVQALEDFRDMLDNIEYAVCEIRMKAGMFEHTAFKDDRARYEAYKDSMRIINNYIPN